MESMKFLSLFILVNTLLMNLNITAQRIVNVEPKIVGNNIEISYDVKGLRYNRNLTVSLLMSRDSGISYVGPLNEVHGDIGPIIQKGKHTIVWETTKEIPLEKFNALFEIRAEVVKLKSKKLFFSGYSGNLITPFGIRVGKIGGIGYYFMCMTNSHPFLSGTYHYNNGAILDYDRFAWYEYTSRHLVSASMICFGANYQLMRDLYLFGGCGYGKEEYMYEIKEYSYEDDQSLGYSYARDNHITEEGIAAEGGIMYHVDHFYISAGITTINLTTSNWLVGIGYVF
jgi:hypothetical protein